MKIGRPLGLHSRAFMGYRKTLIIWVLALSVLVNTSLAQVCFCGKACPDNFRTNEETQISLPFHMPCSGVSCKSCVLEKSQTLKEVNSFKETLRVKLIDSVFILNTPFGFSPSYQILNNLDSFYTFGTIQRPLIYLLNLSILL